MRISVFIINFNNMDTYKTLITKKQIAFKDLSNERKYHIEQTDSRYFRCSNCGEKTRTILSLPKKCNYCKKEDKDMTGGWIMSEISKSEFYNN